MWPIHVFHTSTENKTSEKKKTESKVYLRNIIVYDMLSDVYSSALADMYIWLIKMVCRPRLYSGTQQQRPNKKKIFTKYPIRCVSQYEYWNLLDIFVVVAVIFNIFSLTSDSEANLQIEKS